MTFTLTEMLLVIITGMLMVMSGLLIWLTVRVFKVSGEMQAAVADFQKAVGHINGIAESVETGVALAREALSPSLIRFGALMSGMKRGLSLLLGNRN